MLSLVATLNPVAIYQISSFQIDGHVACLFSILTFSLLRVLALEPGSHDGWVATGLAFLCLAAAKTSGVFYGSAVLGIFALFWLGKKLVVKKEGVVLVGLLGLLICAGLALRSWGQNRALSWDYLRQAMGSGPGYGFGGGASEIEAIRRMSPLEKFASSAFSRTEISVSEARIKLPFELGRRELRVFEELTPDPRAGGFGPWYGTALLLAGLGCLMLVFDGRVAYWPGWFLFLATAASSFGSQVWWARWTPQNWLLLVAMLMTMFAPQPQSGSAEASAVGKVRRLQDAGLRVLAGLACWATLVNVLLVAFYYGVGMVRQEKILNRQIQMAAQMRGRVLLHIPFEMQGHKRGASFKASRLWFVDRKIPTKLLPKIPRTPRMKLNKTNTWILLAPNWRKFLLDPMDERLFRERGLIED